MPNEISNVALENLINAFTSALNENAKLTARVNRFLDLAQPLLFRLVDNAEQELDKENLKK